MNDKIDKDIAIVIICILLVIAAYSAIATRLQLADLRRVNAELESRNRQLELANNQYVQQLDAIASRIADAQRAATGAGDSIQRIRAIVDAIDAIAQDLRKPIAVSQP